MSEKTITTRVLQKTDTKANWDKAVNFIPKKGELIIYSDLRRIKVGDGITKIGALQFLTDDNNDTHYTTGAYVGAANTKSNAPTTNGNTYLKIYDDNTKRAEFKIVGSGATSVTSDANGNITISSTDTVKYIPVEIEVPWFTVSESDYGESTYAFSSESLYNKFLQACENQEPVVAVAIMKVNNNIVTKIPLLSPTVYTTDPITYKGVCYNSSDNTTGTMVFWVLDCSDTTLTIKAITMPRSTLLDSKQDKLTAGTNITINGNTINATPIVAKALTNEDLDTLKTEGSYYAGGGNKVTNKPSGIDAFGLTIKRVASGYFTQYLTGGNTNTGQVYTRTFTTGAWTNWVKFTRDTELANYETIADITNKLKGYEKILNLGTLGATGTALLDILSTYFTDNNQCLLAFDSEGFIDTTTNLLSGSMVAFAQGDSDCYILSNGLIYKFNGTTATLISQDKLVSGTNIKTINSMNILGSGNLDIEPPAQVAKLTGSSANFCDFERYGTSSYKMQVRHGTAQINQNEVVNKAVSFATSFSGVPNVVISATINDTTDTRQVFIELTKVSSSGFNFSVACGNTSYKILYITYIAVYTV